MHSSDLTGLSIHAARELLDNGDISSVELTRAALDRIGEAEPSVSAFVTVTGELALEQARRADSRISSGDAVSLTGIPMQVKDNISTRGVPTTCSSKMLEGFVPPYDATVVRRLYDQGAVLVGKGNLDEFAMGSSTENSAVSPTRNPWDLGRVPGGSSGGPAAAVAAGECLFSLGSDTGGSIRQPASLCGVVGLKPTYGLASRYGLVAFASSLDQIGPITRDAADSALVLNAIAGHDRADSTSLSDGPCDYVSGLDRGVEGLRIGVPKEYFVEGTDPGVEKAVREALNVLEGLGARVEETSLPLTPYALAVYYIIAPSEASANLARYDGVKYGYATPSASGMWDALNKTRQEGFGPEVKRRIMLGAYALSSGYYDAYYLKAQKVRTADPSGAAAGVRGVRRAGHADVAFGRLPLRRKDGGPGADVPERRMHRSGEYSGNTGHIGPRRAVGRSAGGPAASRATPLREDAAAHRARVPEGDELAYDEAASAAGGVERKHIQEDSQWETKTVS